ncbi:MAG: UbiD family decarboxylase [Chloroflexi bacterium]|nr:UbiD family decarboxylase [Chloroflexota bacterium]
MPWSNLRSYLDYLEEKGHLLHISKEVSTEFEIASYIRKSSDADGPAFVFDNVAGYPGWRVLGALYANSKLLADAMDCGPREMMRKYHRATTERITPKLVEHGACQEVVYTGPEVDLTKLPICTHAEFDAGPFITAGVVIAKDPDTGVRLLGILRMQLFGPDRLGITVNPDHRVGRAFYKQVQRGQPLEIAVAIGAHPAVVLGAPAKIAHELDKFGVAGALHGSPIDLVKCRTVDVEVPATAEVVVEAAILPTGHIPEGPFGEFPGTYGGPTQSPIVKVKAITHRKDPIYQTVLACMPVSESHLMVTLAEAAKVFEAARMGCPEVVDVRMRGNQDYDAVVSIRKRLDKEPLNVMMSVLASSLDAKYCTVVDEDIDIYDDRDILWAWETRVQPDRDVHIYPLTVGVPLDPSSPLRRHSSKMGIDATIPLSEDRAKFAKALVPGSDTVSW